MKNNDDSEKMSPSPGGVPGDGTSPCNLLNALADNRRPKIKEPVIIVTAHPDDEVIGIGAQLPRLENVTFVHLTDGSPRNPADAHGAGFATAREYADARRGEFAAVLKRSGIPASRAIELCFRDQEAALHLDEIVRQLREIFARINPRIVVTHPYEGGHPDHDAAAFAVRAACAKNGSGCQPAVIEMTSYHRGDDGMVTSRFLPCPEREVRTLSLTFRERFFKKRLFHCYKTQRYVLASFPIRIESFRIAPDYDFTSPPHPGALHYESLPFGMTGQRFCSLVQATTAARAKS